MTRRINWHARAIYVIVALVMTLGLLLVPLTGSVLAQIDPDLFDVEPSLALNVKGAIEKYTITYDGSTTLPAGINITKWSVTWAWMSTAGTIVDGGQPGNTWISVQAAEPGEAHITAYIDIDGDGVVDATPDAEKKWGEIWCTELTSESLGYNEYIATELVRASFIWGAPGNETRELAADDAVLHWWLMDIAAAPEIQALEADLGDDPCDEDGGCGKWTWQENVAPEDQANDPFNRIRWLQALYPVDHSTAYFWDGWPDTTIDGDGDYATSTTNEDGESGIGVYAASANTVLLVTLAEYPLDYHGENRECVQHETFKPVIPSEQVKSPQLRWAGEKIVLEKEWGVETGLVGTGNYTDEYCGFVYWADFRAYIAGYSLEKGSIGNLEAIEGLGAICIEVPGEANMGLPIICLPMVEIAGLQFSADQVWTTVDGDGISRAILESEQSGQADVNAGLKEISVRIEVCDETGEYAIYAWLEGPVADHGFLVYFLEFEEVALAEDITPASSLAGVSSDESVDVTVQVKGFFDYRHSHLMATTRPEKLLDLDQPGDPGYGVADVILPAGRYVLPDDWWILAGTRDVLDRPNWDMMDMAHEDNIYSASELGPYDTDVWTTDPPGEAEYPCIGPFSTLQSWSSDLMWISQATVPSSLPMGYVRNTVVPDGEDLNWYDAPMPQALVTFEVTGYDSVVNHSLSGLDKGDLEGYGYTGSPKVYHSPFYAVEIPASPYIPPGYDWDSWGGYGPYDYWTDLMIKSFPGDPEPYEDYDQDVEVYCDNHGIAGVTVDPLEAQGSLEITATADYPYAPLKGKYGPRVSPPITIGSRTDLNPHFVVDKVEVAVDEPVTFDPTSTYGGSLPYTRIRWDFEGDDSWDVDLSGSWTPATLPSVAWSYDAEGEYHPCLEVTDSSAPTPVVRTECMSDPYSIVVGAGLTEIEWVCPLGDAPLIAPNPGAGRPELILHADPAGITVDPITEELWGIYYLDEATGDWLYYVPGFAGNTLNMLDPDQYYYVIVSGACTLVVPQV
jgi:hypothetical protein